MYIGDKWWPKTRKKCSYDKCNATDVHGLDKNIIKTTIATMVFKRIVIRLRYVPHYIIL